MLFGSDLQKTGSTLLLQLNLMNYNPLVYPKHVTTIDLETNYSKSLHKAATFVLQAAIAHKWKTALLLATLIGSWKTYGFYRTFRQMTGSLTSDPKPQDSQKLDESKRAL